MPVPAVIPALPPETARARSVDPPQPLRLPGRLVRGALLVGAGLLAACGSSTGTAGGSDPAGIPSTPASPTAVGASPHTVYAALGASETYGVGAAPVTNGYAYRIRDALHLGAGSFADVAIPGATLADAYQPELTNALSIQPTVATLFFGGNDVRAGVPLASFTSDLTDMAATLRRTGMQVLIIGLPDLGRLPAVAATPNASLSATIAAWDGAMQRVAASTGAGFLSLVPFSGEIASRPEDIAADGLHPSNAGHQRLAEIVLATLRSMRYVSP